MAQEVRHLYDAKGQLIAVIDVDGSVATWTWDAEGNLTRISRTDASSIAGAVGITLVNPNAGNVGDPIEIFGKGFSATPTENTITFYNARTATVLVSGTNYVKTTVPTGAATGRITVTTPLGSATSPSNFTVLAAMTISPTNAALLPGRTRQFTASATAVWSVEGQQGGSAQAGTISTSGLYTAPSTGPFPKIVTVAAHSAGDPSNRAEAVVTILPTPLVRARRVSAAVRQTPLQTGPLRAASLTAAVDQAPPQTRNLEASPVAVERQPVITAVSPGSVARGSANVTLTLTGEALGSPTALGFLLNGSPDAAITSTDLTANGAGTQATVTLGIASTAAIAGRVLQLTAGGVSSTPAGTASNVLQITGP